MEFTFTDNLSEKEFNDFSYNHKHGTFFQSSNWAGVKSEWDPIYTGVYLNDELVGACLVLRRKIVFNYSFMYAPRGPLIDYDNKELLEFYLENLKVMSKKRKGISLTIDPAIVRASYPMTTAMFDKENLDVDYDDRLISVINDMGYTHTGFVLNLRDNIQPRFTPYLDLSDDDSYTKSRAYKNAERAIRNRVKIRRGTLDDIPAFEALINKTEESKSISLRSGEYFTRLKKEFKDDCLITFSYLDLEEEIEALNDRYKDLQERLENPTISKGRRNEYEAQSNNVKKDIEFITEKLKDGKIVNIGALMSLKNGSQSELLYSGMDRDFQKYSGSNVNYLDTINWSVESGCDLISFGGCSGAFDEGIDKFKVTFDPMVSEYIGQFTLENSKFLTRVINALIEFRRNPFNRKK